MSDDAALASVRHLQPCHALDCLVAARVFGWEATPTSCSCGVCVTAWLKPRPSGAREMVGCVGHHTPAFSTSMGAAWAVVTLMAELTERDDQFNWEGPLYKPSRHYLTTEGYPLGTTCWYVVLTADGRRRWVCAATPEVAICRAALIATTKGGWPA